jgi:hypothetical protein
MVPVLVLDVDEEEAKKLLASLDPLVAMAKVGFFALRFEVVFLHRAVESVFPPSRLRVWAWYDAIYAALVESEILPRVALPLAERAHVAHEACWREMYGQAEAIGLPVLDYDYLCTAGPEAIAEHVSRGWIGRVVDVPAVVAEIIATRRWTNKQRQNRNTQATAAGPAAALQGCWK